MMNAECIVRPHVSIVSRQKADTTNSNLKSLSNLHNSAFRIPHSAFVLVHVDPKAVGASEQRQSQDTGDYQVEVES